MSPRTKLSSATPRLRTSTSCRLALPSSYKPDTPRHSYTSREHHEDRANQERDEWILSAERRRHRTLVPPIVKLQQLLGVAVFTWSIRAFVPWLNGIHAEHHEPVRNCQLSNFIASILDAHFGRIPCAATQTAKTTPPKKKAATRMTETRTRSARSSPDTAFPDLPHSCIPLRMRHKTTRDRNLCRLQQFSSGRLRASLHAIRGGSPHRHARNMATARRKPKRCTQAPLATISERSHEAHSRRCTSPTCHRARPVP
ncbi:MAG: hypothetical protein ACI9SE_000352 [Neolewinella sp.]|jgi:hypothetical protein